MSDKKILYRCEQNEDRPSSVCDFIFWCPGCKESHGVWTTKKNGRGAIWAFNGNEAAPTFHPSILLTYHKEPARDPATGDFKRGDDGKYLLGTDKRLLGSKEMRCHLFIVNGQIQYCADCTHEFAGKVIPMEAF